MRIILPTLLVITLLILPATAAGLRGEAEQLITEARVDVTGDSVKDLITLKGTKDPRSQIYFENLTLYITNGRTHKIMKLTLNIGGYDPFLSFGNVNGTGAADVLISAATGGSGGGYNYALVAANGHKMKMMPVPQPLEVSGQFEDNYQAKIIIGNQRPFDLDLSDRKKIYDEMGVYQNGKLLKPVDIMVDPFGGLKMIPSARVGVYNLQGTQRVSGFAHYDGILDVVSTWEWTGDHWKPIKIAPHQLK